MSKPSRIRLAGVKMGALPTLGEHLDERDASTFVGRVAELRLLAEVLAGTATSRVVFVRGPGGIGKSSLLRAAARSAEVAGRPVVRVDARSLGGGSMALDSVAAGIDRDRPVLLLLDSWEAAGGLDAHLREHVLRHLHADSVAMIASRRPPEPGWNDGGWDRLRLDLVLGPLGRAEAVEYAALLGVAEADRDGLVTWAGGSPLALTLGALQRDPGADEPEAGVIDRLVHRLVGEELAPGSVAVLEVASIARVVTTDVLAATIPTDPRAAMDDLARWTFAERLEDGLTLHALVGSAIRSQLRARAPSRDRTLRAALADHAYRRSLVRGDALSADLAHLVESEQVRWGFSWDAERRYRLDRARPGDELAIGALMADRFDAAEWDLRRPYLAETPERVVVARDAAGAIAGYAIVVDVGHVPAAAERDPFLRGWLEHARAGPAPERSVMWRNSTDLSGDPDSGIHALFGFAGLRWSGVPNPRFAYLPISAHFEEAKRFSAAVGGRRIPELDQVVCGELMECHVIDHGEGGCLENQLRQVQAELGVTPSSSLGAADPEVLRAALKALTDPARLAATPFAAGATVEERAAHVRQLVVDGMDRAFGPTEPEQDLRRVLERAYLDPRGGHDAAARDLSLSRPVYFRRLKEATERLAVHLRTNE